MSILRTFGCMLFLALPARAEPPRIVVDIAPVQGLVAAVMGDLGAPTVLVEPGQSPHNGNLRPSKARALAQAELVIWMGPTLTPWLQNPVETLAAEVGHIELLRVDGTTLLDARSLEEIGAHSDHDDHDEHDEHDEHAQDDGHNHDHDHEGTDPHAWLDPQNAILWTGIIAEAIARLDPANAAQYAQNADAMVRELSDLQAELTTSLDPLRNTTFLVRHDAYHYFEDRFGLTPMGALTLSDAQALSAGQISELRAQMPRNQQVCVFVERPEDARGVESLLDKINIQIAVADPLGADIAADPAFYPNMMRQLADQLTGCLRQR